VGAWYASLWWIGGLLAILLLIHLLASFIESNGWIYYRKSGPRNSTGNNRRGWRRPSESWSRRASGGSRRPALPALR